jgi:hypothetical protein
MDAQAERDCQKIFPSVSCKIPVKNGNMPSRGFLFWFRRTTFLIIEFFLFAFVPIWLHSSPVPALWWLEDLVRAWPYVIVGMVIWCIFFLRSEPLLARVGLASLLLLAAAFVIRPHRPPRFSNLRESALICG